MERLNFCSQCGHRVRAAARFCAKCGDELKPLETAQGVPRSVEDEAAQVEQLTSGWPWRAALVGLVAVVVFGLGGYLAVQFLAGKVGRSSPAETVRALTLALNQRKADVFQSHLSQWFIGELQREELRGRSLEDWLAESWNRSGSIDQIDILAERICDQEASVYYQVRFANGQARREYANLVTENGIWKINDLMPRGRRSCTVPESALSGKPVQSWPVQPRESVRAEASQQQPTRPLVAQGAPTRPVAARLVGAHPIFSSVKAVQLAEPVAQTLEGGVREGLFLRPNYWNYVLSEEGRRFFVVDQPISSLFVGPLAMRFPVPPQREVVEVTGVTDESSNLKRVLFTWRYSGLSDVAARYTGQGTTPHEGVAQLRLYDDGWRVEELLELRETGRVPFRLDQNLLVRAEAARQANVNRLKNAKSSTVVLLTSDRAQDRFGQVGMTITNAIVRGPDQEMGHWEIAQVHYQPLPYGVKKHKVIATDGGRKLVEWLFDDEDEARSACQKLYEAALTWQQNFPELRQHQLVASGCGR